MSSEPWQGENVLVHVGYPKCASTALQEGVFDNRDLGFVSPLGKQTIHLREHCAAMHPFELEDQIESVRAVYRDSLVRGQGLINTFSHETAFLHPYAWNSAIRDGIWRLSLIFDGARFLMVIREQKSVLISSYREALRRGHVGNFASFIGLEPDERLGYHKSGCSIDDFRYDQVIAHMYSVLGRENVIVMPFEKAIRPGAVDLIRRSFGLDPLKQDFFLPRERSKRKGDFVLLPYINYGRKYFGQIPGLDTLMYYSSIALSPIVPSSVPTRIEQRLSDQVKSHLGSYYSESNRRTSELIDEDLSSLGYS